MPKTTLKYKSPVFTGEVYVMKEKEGSNVKVYHITDGADINNLKCIEAEEKKRIIAITDQVLQENKPEFVNTDSMNIDFNTRNISETRPSAPFFGTEQNSTKVSSLIRPQIINFNNYTSDNLMANPFKDTPEIKALNADPQAFD